MPGAGPHPRRDPAGHSFGAPEPSPPPLGPETWSENETWLYGVDLYNEGFFWESHEQWESLWHAHGRRGETATFLKALIQTAAARIKLQQDYKTGVRRLWERARRRSATPRGRVGRTNHRSTSRP